MMMAGQVRKFRKGSGGRGGEERRREATGGIEKEDG